MQGFIPTNCQNKPVHKSKFCERHQYAALDVNDHAEPVAEPRDPHEPRDANLGADAENQPMEVDVRVPGARWTKQRGCEHTSCSGSCEVDPPTQATQETCAPSPPKKAKSGLRRSPPRSAKTKVTSYAEPEEEEMAQSLAPAASVRNA